MKIALAIENFSTHAGGAERYAVDLAGKLVAEGWQVHLFGYSWDGYPREAVFHPIRKPSKWVPPSLRVIDFALQHRKLVSREHFDIVLGFGNTIVMDVYQSHGGVHHISSVKKLGAVRNPLHRLLKMLLLFGSPKYHARAWVESAPFRMPHRPLIIAISEMLREDMSRYFLVSQEEIELVYNGIDVERFRQMGLDEEGKKLRHKLGFDKQVLFVFMAFDFRKKGVSFLLEAAASLRDQVPADSFGVVVVGGPPSPALTKRIRNLNLSDIVIFPGKTRTPELFYQACDVFVLPTFYDACSLVVFEAMAAGLPAITSVHNGAAGIIEDGIDGKVLQDPANVDELAAAMRWLLDPETLKNASEAARNKASQYTLERNHQQILAILNKALRGKKTE
jgi:UDP-glucose:(heptosyl)LPS alpha-1,3-glucosyltransferase